jgi:hypothetical protein
MKKILFILFVSIFSLSITAAEWGKLSGNMPQLKQAGPIHHSKYFVTNADVKDGKINARIPINTEKNVVIMVTGFATTQATLDNKKPVAFKRYNTPDLESMEIPGVGSRIQLEDVKPGLHLITIEGKKMTETVQLIVAEPDSPLEMKAQITPLAVKSGETVTVQIHLNKEVYSPSVKAKAFLANGQIVELNDNGQSSDKIAGDGIFTGTFIANTMKNFEGINMRIETEGTLNNGFPFKRTSSAAVMITNPQTTIEDLVVNDKNLKVCLGEAEGKYRVEVVFGTKEQSIAYARETVAAENRNLEVLIPRPSISAPATKAIVRVLNMNSLGLDDEMEIKLTPFTPDEKIVIDKKPANKQAVLPLSKIEAAKTYGDFIKK